VLISDATYFMSGGSILDIYWCCSED